MRRAAALLLFALAAPAPALAEESVHADDWYAVYVNGTKAGHAHTVVLRVVGESGATEDRPSWITTTDTYLKLARNGAEVDLELATLIEEDADGRVVRFRQAQKMSGVDVVTRGRLDGDVIRLDQNGVHGDTAYPAGALGPAASDRKVLASGFEPGTSTSLLGFSTDSPGEGSQLTFLVEGAESQQVIDRRLRLHKVKTTNSRSASRSMYMWLDGRARMQVSESDVPGVGILRMERTTETLARAVTNPAEIFAASLIEPDRGISGPRRATRATFRFSRTDGKPFEATLHEDEAQHVGPLREDGARDVRIETWSPPDAFTAWRRPIEDSELAPFLAKSAYLEIDDPLIGEHARRAVGDERDALACARRIELYVRRFVTDKSMDVGFATAAEVARSGEGDCSEHAMLAAALARVEGLPSRLVMGLVYVPGMSGPGVGAKGAFGYHMWTEILVARDRWLPIDAAIGGFDATHIAMAKSDLSTTSPVSQMILPLLEVIAAVRIEVVSVEADPDGE
jgi:hypothetical protein